MSRRFGLWCLLALLILGVGGCVHESVDGATRTFSNEWWVPCSVLLGGIAAVPAGWALRQKITRLAWVLLIGGPIAAIGFAPSLFLDRSTLNDKTFSLRTGIWGMTSVHSVNFDDLTQVRLIVEKSTGRRGRQNINYYLMCDRKDGSNVKIPVNNNIAEAAAPYFIEELHKRSIPVMDQTGGI